MQSTKSLKAQPRPLKSVDVLGVPFHAVTFTEAVEHLSALARSGRCTYAVTANVDHAVRIHRQPELLPLYEQADLVVADGAPLIWASRLLGTRLPHRVAGSDLFPALCREAACVDLSVFLLGGAPGAADESARVLSDRHPGLRVAGTFCPPLGFEQDPMESQRVIDAVRGAAPDILFVGLGSPKQERWIVANREACGVGLSIGVGISFGFVSGQVRRAPRWIQRLGLEWLHRLVQEPRRLWRRYLIDDMVFVPLLLKALVRRMLGRSKQAGPVR